MLDSGVVLDARYRLEERLATGGMGDVWRGIDVTLGRTVAVKVLLPALLTDPSFGVRFRAEARMLATLHHPGVVRVYDYGETTPPDSGPVAYLVMEYVDGEPLSQRLTDAGTLDAKQTMSVVAQAAEALHAAHTAGIVHRDVKPSNLLLRPDRSVTLVDFGVARSSGATSITSANAVIGTAMYMAPEQASGQPVSAATDIYALGAVAYHCLAGEPPFAGNNPLEIAVRHINDEPPALPAEVPAPVRGLVSRALAKDPAIRYPNAAAFAAAARAAAVPGAAPPTVPVAPVVDQPAWRRPSKRVVAAATAGALLLLGGLAALLALNPNNDNTPPSNNVVPPSSASATAAQQPVVPAGTGTGTTRKTSGATRTSAAPVTTAASPAPATTGADETETPTTAPTPPAGTVDATTPAAGATGEPDASAAN